MEKERWSAEVEALILRFRKAGPAEKKFELRSGVTVIDPVKFHASMAEELKDGPRSPRGRTGALVADLKEYLAIREGRSSGTSEGLPGKNDP